MKWQTSYYLFLLIIFSMKFRTEIQIKSLAQKIEHYESIFTIGSCFAENVGEYFERYKFRCMVNPFGVLYNTASIKNSIEFALQKKIFTKEDLIYDQSEWHSFNHHSDFSHHNHEIILEKINSISTQALHFIKKADWIIISLGTSFVYRHLEKNFIVSNCHKISPNRFRKEFLSISENSENLAEIIELIKVTNPKAKFILTVSPVRHWKDGAHENQLSKSSLHLSVNDVIQKFIGVYYFPSYEIVMDELRDYRFYKKDLLHPSEEAIDYIWKRFSESCFSKDCQFLLNQIQKVLDAFDHNIRNTKSQASKVFAAKNLDLVKEIQSKQSYIDFEKELNKFNSILENRETN